jgi:hypothetical protein
MPAAKLVAVPVLDKSAAGKNQGANTKPRAQVPWLNQKQKPHVKRGAKYFPRCEQRGLLNVGF